MIQWLLAEQSVSNLKGTVMTLRLFIELGGMEIDDPVERLKFFCSLAMDSQDWVDCEQFFNDIVAATK